MHGRIEAITIMNDLFDEENYSFTGSSLFLGNKETIGLKIEKFAGRKRDYLREKREKRKRQYCKKNSKDNKQDGIIRMEMFLNSYLDIMKLDWQELFNPTKLDDEKKLEDIIKIEDIAQLLSYITHDDLLKLKNKLARKSDSKESISLAEKIIRVPFDIADTYSSQFLYVIDCNGSKLAYYNPLEKIIVNDDEHLYNNKNFIGVEKCCYIPEYEPSEYDGDLLEEELQELYSDIGEKKYGKYKRE